MPVDYILGERSAGDLSLDKRLQAAPGNWVLPQPRRALSQLHLSGWTEALRWLIWAPYVRPAPDKSQAPSRRARQELQGMNRQSPLNWARCRQVHIYIYIGTLRGPLIGMCVRCGALIRQL